MRHVSPIDSLVAAVLRVNGDCLVMHVGERPYVLSPGGSSNLSERTLTVEFRAPPAAAELERLPRVTRVQALSDRGLRLHWSGDTDPGPSLAEEAARRGWGLARLAPGRVSLEEVFVRLTRNEGQDVGSEA